MKISNQEKALLKNTGILALGTLLSKILTFFLLPLYTAYLATEDFGNVDVLQTIAFLLIPIVSLELCSATFRFLIDQNDLNDKKYIISSTIFIQLINIVFFTIIVFIIDLFIKIDYCNLFVIYFITNMMLLNIQYVVRGFGNNKLFSFMSFLMTFVALVLNILLIAVFKCKADAILIAQIIASFITFIYGAVRIKLFKYIDFSHFSKSHIKELLSYSLPLIPNSISWWIANTSDRLLIRFFIDSNANGIYAVANKIPTIYTTIFNVYNLAWVESVSREIGKKDSEKFINGMYEKSIRLFGCMFIGIICVMSIAYKLIIGSNYYSAYFHIYILMVAIFFNSLCSIIGSILTGLKKSKVIGTTTVVGALVNVIINLSLINFIGLYAASVSTLVSYIVIFLVRNREVSKSIHLSYPLRYIVSMIIALIITSIGYYLRNNLVNIIILIYLIIWTFTTNKVLLIGIIESIYIKIRKK